MLLVLLAVSLVAGCAKPTEETRTLTVMTHDSFAVSEDVVKEFETENNVTLVFIKSGDTGAALNRAILTKSAPQADVFYGVDNTFLSRAIQEDIFEPYTPAMLANIPAEFTAGAMGKVVPIDYADVCINYDKAWFADRGLVVPVSLSDLLKPQYGAGANDAGLLVVENPATSSPGLAFLLATVSEFGQQFYLEFWRDLKQQGVEVVNDWETAYYTNFSASSGKGLQPMVVSYATSPAAEVIYASTPLDEAPTASIVAPGTCFRQVEYAGILKGTQNFELAQRFIDFMLDTRFQQDMPLQMFVYPVNPDAVLPEEFTRFALQAIEPAVLDPVLIAENRDKWLAEWSEVMLP
jgi:thiamine transport system substrate-binding protein